MSHDHCHEDGHCHHHHCCSEKTSHHEHDCCHHHHQGCDFSQQLLQLADQAWWNVLEEKIEAEVRQQNGAYLDALAKAVAQSNDQRWKSKIAQKSAIENLEAEVARIFKK